MLNSLTFTNTHSTDVCYVRLASNHLNFGQMYFQETTTASTAHKCRDTDWGE